MASLTGRPEPVVVLDAVKAVVAVAVAYGWSLDDTLATSLTTGIGGVAYVILTLITRSRTTPLADPRDAQGQPLVSGRHARPENTGGGVDVV